MAVKSKTKVASVDTTEAQKLVNDLKNSIAELSKTNEESAKSVKDLREQLKLQKDVMAGAEEGTEKYNAALRQAAEIQHLLREQTSLINNSAADFGQIVSNTTSVLGGMIAGFQSANAVMNMFSVENEEVIKSLQKMQNLMALTQALPALDKAYKGFVNLRTVIQTTTGATGKFGKALVSTGLGALVVALGYIVSHFEEISKWLDEITGQTDFLGTVADSVMGGLNAGWAGLVQTLKAVGNAIVTYVTAPFKSVWAAIQAYTSTNGGFANKLKAAGKAMKDGFVSDWKDVGNDFKQIGTAAADAYQEGFNKNRAKRLAESEEERKARLEAEKKAAEEEAKAIAEIKKKYNSLAEDIKLYNATELLKQLVELDKAEKEALKTIEDAYSKRLISTALYENNKKQIEDHYRKLREDTEKQAANKEAEEERKRSIDLIDTTYQLELAKLLKQYDEKLISEADYTERKKELLNTYVQDYVDNIQFMLDTETNITDEQLLNLTTKINDARALLKPDELPKTEDGEQLTAKQISEAINASALALNEFSDNPAWGNILKNVATLTANWETLNTNIQKGGKEAFTAYTQIAATALSAVAQMFNGLAAEQDTSNKEGFESAKKFQIAGATMSMLAGITSAWASSMALPSPANVIVGSLLSAMMLGTGIANITKIKSQQFDSKSSVSNSTPSGGAITSINAPVQYTQDVQGAEIEGTIKDTKVYVTETDISNTQNKVDVAESEARY